MRFFLSLCCYAAVSGVFAPQAGVAQQLPPIFGFANKDRIPEVNKSGSPVFDKLRNEAMKKKQPLVIYLTGSSWCSQCNIFTREYIKKTNFKNTSIVIMGIAISALFDAGIQYLNISNSENIQTILLWLTGSVWGRYWNEVKVLTPYVVIFIPLAIVLAHKVDILSLGDNIAINLGEKVSLLKVGLLLIGIILTTSSVSVSGTIGFVGLVAPHIAKNLVGYKHILVIPLSGLIGAILLITADIIGRTIIAPSEIPVGIVTAIIGAPYFLYLLLRKKSN